MEFIYKITNKVNGKIYVGKTSKTIKNRFKEHVRSANRNEGYLLHKAIRKYGEKNFELELLFESENSSFICKMEIVFIIKFQSYNQKFGYNLTKVGEGGNMTETTKQKLRGENNPNFGKSMSDKQKQVLSKRTKDYFSIPENLERHKESMKGRKAWNKGKKLGTEYGVGGRKNKGRKMSEATKQKMRESRLAYLNNNN